MPTTVMQEEKAKHNRTGTAFWYGITVALLVFIVALSAGKYWANNLEEIFSPAFIFEGEDIIDVLQGLVYKFGPVIWFVIGVSLFRCERYRWDFDAIKWGMMISLLTMISWYGGLYNAGAWDIVFGNPTLQVSSHMTLQLIAVLTVAGYAVIVTRAQRSFNNLFNLTIGVAAFDFVLTSISAIAASDIVSDGLLLSLRSAGGNSFLILVVGASGLRAAKKLAAIWKSNRTVKF